MNIRQRIIVLACMLGFIITGLVAVLAPGADASDACITRKEFRQLDKGDSIWYVRAIVGQHGRVLSDQYFSDGDEWKTLSFRQCGKTWRQSWVIVDFEKRSHEEYVSDWECYEPGNCYDYGYYETVYSGSLVLSGKSAVWR